MNPLHIFSGIKAVPPIVGLVIWGIPGVIIGLIISFLWEYISTRY